MSGINVDQATTALLCISRLRKAGLSREKAGILKDFLLDWHPRLVHAMHKFEETDDADKLLQDFLDILEEEGEGRPPISSAGPEREQQKGDGLYREGSTPEDGDSDDENSMQDERPKRFKSNADEVLPSDYIQEGSRASPHVNLGLDEDEEDEREMEMVFNELTGGEERLDFQQLISWKELRDQIRNGSVEEETIAEIWNDVDTDDDGKLDFAEFLIFLEKCESLVLREPTDADSVQESQRNGSDWEESGSRDRKEQGSHKSRPASSHGIKEEVVNLIRRASLKGDLLDGSSTISDTFAVDGSALDGEETRRIEDLDSTLNEIQEEMNEEAEKERQRVREQENVGTDGARQLSDDGEKTAQPFEDRTGSDDEATTDDSTKVNVGSDDQAASQASEENAVEAEDQSTKDDVDMLVAETGVSREEAVKALRENKGDLVNAAMSLAT